MSSTVGLALFLFAAVSLTFGIGANWKSRRFRIAIEKREEQIKRKMYEIAILKEVSDRVGYSLSVEKILSVITGSLDRLITYSTASYMLVEPDRVIFNLNLEESVSDGFIKDVEGRMRSSLSALLSQDLASYKVDKTVTGTLIDDESTSSVRSFFNIPIVIDGIVVGLITVADTKAGLYKEEDMTILYKITNQASLAITQLQQVVKTEQAKLRSMVEGMSDSVVMMDTEYRVSVVNKAAKQTLGFADVDTVGVFDVIEKLGGAIDLRTKLEECMHRGEIISGEELTLNDRYYQLLIAPAKGSSGAVLDKVLGAVIILHDITKEKEVEKLRDDFTSMLVHEMRTPLDSIKKMSALIRSEGVGKDIKGEEEYLQMIYQNSSQMLEMVNDLLDVAKLESGKFDISKRTSDIKRVVKERLMFFKISAKDRDIRLAGVLGPDIPNEMDFDPMRIGQVINNFLSNAVKFTPKGGQVTAQVLRHRAGAHVKVEAQMHGVKWFMSDDEAARIDALEGDVIVIAVTDSGSGISEVDITKLFQKFKQVGLSVHNGVTGTGLGLVVSKGIVETHDGIVGLASREGVGSTFYFTLRL